MFVISSKLFRKTRNEHCFITKNSALSPYSPLFSPTIICLTAWGWLKHCLLRLLFTCLDLISKRNTYKSNLTIEPVKYIEKSRRQRNLNKRFERVDVRYQVSSVSTCRHKASSFERVDLSTKVRKFRACRPVDKGTQV